MQTRPGRIYLNADTLACWTKCFLATSKLISLFHRDVVTHSNSFSKMIERMVIQRTAVYIVEGCLREEDICNRKLLDLVSVTSKSTQFHGYKSMFVGIYVGTHEK